MKQKYHIWKNLKEKKLIIQEYAVLNTNSRRSEIPVLEDEDFSLQLKKNYKILYSTNIRAYHYPHSAPLTRLSTFKRSRLRAFNYRYFYQKHRVTYGFKPVPHFISCIGFVLESLINRRSLTAARGLIAGYRTFRKKRLSGEIAIPK